MKDGISSLVTTSLGISQRTIERAIQFVEYVEKELDIEKVERETRLTGYIWKDSVTSDTISWTKRKAEFCEP